MIELPHISLDRGLWLMKENGETLAWEWTLRAFIIAFAEDENILMKIRNFRNYHIYAMIPNHPISEDAEDARNEN